MKSYMHDDGRYAGKRKGRLLKKEEVEGGAFLQDGDEKKLPFDGQVGIHLEEWLEQFVWRLGRKHRANVQGCLEQVASMGKKAWVGV